MSFYIWGPKYKVLVQVIHYERSLQVQGNENDDRMRVRRARVADVPRVLRFVREHAKTAWPGLISSPPSASQLVLSDYVARALAQGMLRVTNIHLILTMLGLQKP